MRTHLALLAAALALTGCAGLTAPAADAPAPQPAPLTAAEIAANPNPHAGKPRCVTCHQREGKRELREDPIALCKRCHQFAMGNHPVAVVQKAAVAGLPLLEGGKVACHTCHDPHTVRKPNDGLRMEFNQLCMSCHTRGGGSRVHDRHGQKR